MKKIKAINSDLLFYDSKHKKLHLYRWFPLDATLYHWDERHARRCILSNALLSSGCVREEKDNLLHVLISRLEEINSCIVDT